jgi:hypothetical protein
MNKTNVLAILAAISSLAAIPVASAQDVTCKSANFSQAVLDRFGSIRYSCLEIVERNGEPHAVLNAEVIRVSPPTVIVKFKRADGGFSNSYRFTPAEDHEFNLDGGRKTKLRDLTATSILRIYVPVDAPVGKLGFEIDPATGKVIYFEIGSL